jgi:hypothetical protein
MNLSRIDIAECIEAYYEGNEPTAQDIAIRIDYLLENLNVFYSNESSESTYAIGDTMNLLELIKEKLTYNK